jgi:hypothetical protein
MELRAVKTFYTDRLGVVELEDDVLSIVRQVREMYGDRVTVNLEPTTGEYVFIEHSDDGTEKLIFTTPELDGRALQRLIASDSQSRGYEDAYEKLEKEQDEAHRALDEENLEKIRDAGERLAWALGDGRYGPGYHQSIRVNRDLGRT